VGIAHQLLFRGATPTSFSQAVAGGAYSYEPSPPRPRRRKRSPALTAMQLMLNLAAPPLLPRPAVCRRSESEHDRSPGDDKLGSGSEAAMCAKTGSVGRLLYAKARSRDRIDAGIAHEYEEAKGGGSHEYAYEHAPDTELPIRHEARALARTIRGGERRRRRRG
jgi:hypothetical protein